MHTWPLSWLIDHHARPRRAPSTAVYPRIMPSGDANTVLVTFAVERCVLAEGGGGGRRRLLGPANGTVCTRVNAPGGGSASIFTWDRRTGAYIQALYQANVLNFTSTAPAYSVNPDGEILAAAVSADGRTAVMQLAYMQAMVSAAAGCGRSNALAAGSC